VDQTRGSTVDEALRWGVSRRRSETASSSCELFKRPAASEFIGGKHGLLTQGIMVGYQNKFTNAIAGATRDQRRASMRTPERAACDLARADLVKRYEPDNAISAARSDTVVKECVRAKARRWPRSRVGFDGTQPSNTEAWILEDKPGRKSYIR
jgi:hypothetical protein